MPPENLGMKGDGYSRADDSRKNSKNWLDSRYVFEIYCMLFIYQAVMSVCLDTALNKANHSLFIELAF